MATNQNHGDDGDASSIKERSESNAPWSDLDHDLHASSIKERSESNAPWSDLDHVLVMMRLGVVDFLSFRGVCKSWRSLACENKYKFMASMPPMSISISLHNKNKKCYLKDFKGRKFKTILTDFAGGDCIGVTCGYLIFFKWGTSDFWLLNLITRKQLHFPDFPFDYHSGGISGRAILVYSTSRSGWVFAVAHKYSGDIWFCIEGKAAWTRVSHSFNIIDIYAFKGKIYTLSLNHHYPVCEMGLGPHPKLTTLAITRPHDFYPNEFVSSGENLYVMGRSVACLYELDVGEMKWVKPCEKTLRAYSFVTSSLNGVVPVKRESWSDPRSRSHGRFSFSLNTYDNGRFSLLSNKMWYFPHQCMNVDCIDE